MEATTQRQWLLLLKEKKGLSTVALGVAVGVSRITVHRWLNEAENSKPNLAQAAKLAKLAGTTVDEVARIFGCTPESAAA